VLEASAYIAVAYLVFGSPVYFPWYAVFPVALLALVPRLGTITLIFILAFMSRAIAPLVDLQPQYHPIPIAPFQLTNAGILIGLAAFAVILLAGFLRWAAAREADDERADLDWLLDGLDRRIGVPAAVTGLADRYQRRSFRAAGAGPATSDMLTAEEIAARTAPPTPPARSSFERPTPADVPQTEFASPAPSAAPSAPAPLATPTPVAGVPADLPRWPRQLHSEPPADAPSTRAPESESIGPTAPAGLPPPAAAEPPAEPTAPDPSAGPPAGPQAGPPAAKPPPERRRGLRRKT
jgi:hypothetical protein